ncbi:hypothetical protein BH20VER1_BH20VER1_21680 [soil metagenome]
MEAEERAGTKQEEQRRGPALRHLAAPAPANWRGGNTEIRVQNIG